MTKIEEILIRFFFLPHYVAAVVDVGLELRV
jgi:hypothetical protein